VCGRPVLARCDQLHGRPVAKVGVGGLRFNATNLLGICVWEACSCALRAAARQTCSQGWCWRFDMSRICWESVSGRPVLALCEQLHGRPAALVQVCV